ncbi:hypothetical protein [Planococcus lenghuensis]|uniref:Uncharacterized protein n=1 Tax=Planococcus lenghuensis TaxID=2213202 RepID=A0A1Q2L0V9_9BACL|nr:hypothetical protein [Planococcus lenghuensis]AQQ53532.1 hypothetical protein B0X71_10915 [Planococcus lenghuensis]
MLDRLKNHPTSKGKPVNEYLFEKHANGEWDTIENDVIFTEPSVGVPVTYKWTLTDTGIEAANSQAAELTPDLHNRSEIVTERRTVIPADQLGLYDFVRFQVNMHGDMALALKEATIKYDVNLEQAKEIYTATEKHLYERS